MNFCKAKRQCQEGENNSKGTITQNIFQTVFVNGTFDLLMPFVNTTTDGLNNGMKNAACKLSLNLKIKISAILPTNMAEMELLREDKM